MLFKEISLQQSGSLSIVQIGSAEQDTFSFISGAAAIRQNLLEVKEISESGSVNDLIILNHSNDFAFFMDGDILEGAKQNRVLNTSVLLAPESKTIVPVSCVERGRWRHVSDKFSPSDFSAPIRLRSAKAEKVRRNMKSGRQHTSDQAEVWNNVSFYSEKMKVHSDTESLTDVYEGKKDLLKELTQAFTPDNGACGAAIFIKKKLMSIDVFGRTDIFRECFPRLIKAAALDALGQNSKIPLKEGEAFYKTLSMLDKIEKMESSEHNGAGSGKEKRFSAPDVTGFELTYLKNLIHLSVMMLEPGRRIVIE